MTAPPRKVLLVGWDAADWKVIHPLVDAGKMPHTGRLIETGAMANLATLQPVLSPMLWTSIATGKRPYKHGILGFSEPTPDGGAVQPVSNLSRTTKALWNILNQQGKRSIVVGWWPSHPVEPINGAMVSNHYHTAVGPPDQPWPMAAGTVHPESLIESLAELRVNPNELTPEEILPFIPKVLEIDQDQDKRLVSVMKTLAECSSVNNAATWLMANRNWDFCGVYFDAIDHFCHGFMKYHPPRQDWISEADYALYKDVVNTAYCYHDVMLGALLRQAGPDVTVIICSDHGFHPDHLRPRQLPSEPAGPAAEHRDHGVLLIAGPGIKQDHFLHGVNLLDITPTILTLYGLPVGADMDGKPLVQAFETPPRVETIPSWDRVPGDSAMHPPEKQSDPLAAREALQQLIALGYIEALDENREQAVARTARELRYNLARAYMNGDRHADALPILQELYRAEPGEYRFGIQSALCMQALGHIRGLRSLVENLIEQRKRDGRQAREQLKALTAEIEQRKQAAGDDAEARERAQASEKEQAELKRLRSLAHVRMYDLDYLMGYVNLAEHQPRAALEYLGRAVKVDATRPGLFIQIGEAYLQLKCWVDAETVFQRALALDPLNSHAHLGLARSCLGQRKNKQAAEEALTTVSLLYHYPMAHYCLGLALLRLRRVEQGESALQIAVALNPNFLEAHQRLVKLYRKRLDNPAKAAEHRALARAIRRQRREGKQADPVAAPGIEEVVTVPASVHPSPQPSPRPAGADKLTELDPSRTITIVSGLPRTGTSMMMQMLAAGGLPTLSDGKRVADADNPKGYYELDAATRLRQDKDWLQQARGKGVKIVAQLLPGLPADHHYRIIFMERDLDEVLASQRAMLERLGRQQAKLTPEQLKQAFKRQLQNVKVWLAQAPHIHVLYVDHRAALIEPRATADRVSAFLQHRVAAEAMTAVVDKALYRQRAATGC